MIAVQKLQCCTEEVKFVLFPEQPNFGNVPLSQVTPAGSDSIHIAWQSLDQNVNSDALLYYGYAVQYRQLDEASWITRDVPARGEFSDYTYQIDGLQYNSVYEVQVYPYRQIGNHRDTGQPTHILNVKTACLGKKIIFLRI